VEMLNVQKLNALKDCHVTLFPDKGKAFLKWSKIAEDACFEVKVNDVIEHTDLDEGDEIADLVISIMKIQTKHCHKSIIEKMMQENRCFKMPVQVFDLDINL